MKRRAKLIKLLFVFYRGTGCWSEGRTVCLATCPFDDVLSGLWVYSGIILHRASPCTFDTAPSELPKLFKGLQIIHQLNIIANFRCRGVPPSINLNSFYKENSRTITTHISISKTGRPLREGWCLASIYRCNIQKGTSDTQQPVTSNQQQVPSTQHPVTITYNLSPFT